jgi:hypothetical protein
MGVRGTPAFSPVSTSCKMLTYSRSLTQRTVSKYANGGARSAARGVAASAVVVPSSRAVSGQRVKTLAQVAISKYSTNPYLNVRVRNQL